MKILDTLHQKDIIAFFWIQQYRRNLVSACREISRTADGFFYALITILYWSVSDVEGLHFCKIVVVAFAIERSLYYVMKHTCKRSRPQNAIPGFRSDTQVSDEFSFPSGHTCGAFLFVTLCCLLLTPWFAALYGWALLVALSRVVLGVHFPTDVAVGALLGVMIGIGVAG